MWTVKLWHRDPAKRFAILGVAIVAALIGFWLLRSVSGILSGFGAIMISTADFWLPLRYTLDGTGARVRCGISVTAIEWSAVKRAIESEEGIKLSPLERPTRTSAFRGVFVRYNANRDEVIARVRSHWEGDVRPLEG